MIEEAENRGDQELANLAYSLHQKFTNASRAFREIYKETLEATQELADTVYSGRFNLESRKDKTALRKAVRSCVRSLLPIGTEAPIVISQNYRQWRTALVQRGSEAAELEIRKIYIKCLEILQDRAPHIFGDFEVFRAKDGTLACRTEFVRV
jgi:thymidylate synthase ThyX